MKSFKNFVSEAKKYSMKQAMDMMMDNPWGLNKMTKDDIRWYIGKDGKNFWMDNLSGELIPAKETKPPKGVKVYKKESVEEGKKYSMKQAMDWFGSDEKDIAWTMSSKKRGEPLFGHWLDMSTGEVVAAKEKNPPKGVKVYKKESVEEGKKANLRDLDHDEFMKYGDTNPRGRADPEWNKERKRRYKNDMQRTRRKQMKKESVEEGKFIGDRYHHSIKDKDIPGVYVGRDGEDFISGTERVGRKTEFTIKAIKLGGWPKNLDKDRWLRTFPKGRGKPDELDGDEVRRVIQRYTKKKQMKNEELAGTSTADVVGTGDDVADWKDPKKKKKTKPLTRHFIEVGGKRRKLTK